jgi:hypothetical protein
MSRAICYFIIAFMSISTVVRISCNAKILAQMLASVEHSHSNKNLMPMQQSSPASEHPCAKFQKSKRRFGDEVEKHMKIAADILVLPRFYFKRPVAIKAATFFEHPLSPPERPPG